MLRTIIATVSVLTLVSAAIGQDVPRPAATSPKGQFNALVEEYEQQGLTRELVDAFVQLAKKHPKDPIAVDALIWVVTNVRTGKELSVAMEMLSSDHITSDRLAPLCRTLALKPSLAAEKLLRSLPEKSPHENVQAHACLNLADYLKRQIKMMRSLKQEPSLARRYDQYLGAGFSDHLGSLNEIEVSTEIERLYTRILESYAEVPTTNGSMGEEAEENLFAIHHLSVGKKAPNIQGEDIDGKPLKLTDYRGKVILLDFWGHW